MNTIKFRGKILNGERKREWVYGSYLEVEVQGVKHARIIPIFDQKEEVLDGTIDIDCIPVDPKTVGQYIGKKDKNGKEAYIGDISKSFFGDNIGVIEWHKTNSWIVLRYIDSRNGMYSFDHLSLEAFEIIGNITDTPDLLTQ